uniref:Uncharacterized protein n=1 Tax=Avena sativa TaxID=4498 RepID=A0ACD6A966_AVESA
MASPPPVPATPAPASQRKRGPGDSIGLYVVQCCGCHKWRTIPTKDEFETIRENLTNDPWFCSKRPDCSCEDPADIEYDSSRIWVIDRPNIPKPPPKTKRLAIIRRDLTGVDICYVLPNGKRAKSVGDVQKFLDANPEYKDSLSVENFSFTLPKVAEETVTGGFAWRRNKKAKKQGKVNASSTKK